MELDPRQMNWQQLRDQLGHVIPCYAKSGGGCHVNDEANEKCQEDTCLLLKMYREGYTAGLEARNR